MCFEDGMVYVFLNVKCKHAKSCEGEKCSGYEYENHSRLLKIVLFKIVFKTEDHYC